MIINEKNYDHLRERFWFLMDFLGLYVKQWFEDIFSNVKDLLLRINISICEYWINKNNLEKNNNNNIENQDIITK